MIVFLIQMFFFSEGVIIPILNPHVIWNPRVIGISPNVVHETEEVMRISQSEP